MCLVMLVLWLVMFIVHVHHHGSQFIKQSTLQRFSEVICHHLLSRTVLDRNLILLDTVSHKEVSHIDMLGKFTDCHRWICLVMSGGRHGLGHSSRSHCLVPSSLLLESSRSFRPDHWCNRSTVQVRSTGEKTECGGPFRSDSRCYVLITYYCFQSGKCWISWNKAPYNTIY